MIKTKTPSKTVFISYSRSDKAIAEQLAHSIRARGFDVFFDRTDVTAGRSYEKKIEKAINTCDLFVFLITPSSIARGKYALTELSIAEARWPVADGNVLPVMLEATPIEQIPSYLKSISLLEPQGNISAEVSADVEELLSSRSKFSFAKAGTIGVGMLSLVAFGFYHFTAHENLSINIGKISTKERSIFGRPTSYTVATSLENYSNESDDVFKIKVNTYPSGVLKISEESHQFVPLPPNSIQSTDIQIERSSGEDQFEFEICILTLKDAEICSAKKAWSDSEIGETDNHFPISDEMSQRVTTLEWSGEHYLVGLQRPSELVKMDELGQVIASVSLEGVPTEISSGELGLFVGVKGPNKLIKVDSDSFSVVISKEIVFPQTLRGTFGEVVSTQPATLSQDENSLWITTGGGDSAGGLAYLDSQLQSLDVPNYFEEISFDLSGFQMKGGYGAMWSGQMGTVPASIVRMLPHEYKEFGGHDYELASCTDSLIPTDEGLIAIGCKGIIQKLLLVNGELQGAEKLGYTPGYDDGEYTWTSSYLFRTEQEAIISIVKVGGVRGSQTEKDQLTVGLIKGQNDSKILLELSDANIEDAAVGSKSILLFLKSKEGKNELISLGLP